MTTGLCTDRRFRDHVPPGEHPERPERLQAIEEALEQSGLAARCRRIAARPATREELLCVHDAAYLDRLEDEVTRGAPSGWLDPDTYYSPGTWSAALLAAGAAVDLARAVAAAEVDNAIGLVRPPGHHATRDRAMGFCLINNVAVAAAALRREGARVAIVDWDVHHGNGTEAIFYDDAEVLYASLHQWPFYPGTGALGDRGGGAGLGHNLNVPLPTGSGDAAYLRAFDGVILPALARFRPDHLLLSAGFDGHRRDPLAGMALSDEGFGALAGRLLDATQGRLTALLEGGYDLTALAGSALAVVRALLGDPAPASFPGAPSAVEIAAIERARRAHGL